MKKLAARFASSFRCRCCATAVRLRAAGPGVASARPASARPALGRAPVKPATSHAPASTTMLAGGAERAAQAGTASTCHNDRTKAGTMSLQAFDTANVLEHTELAEKMIRKLRAGMMPPAGARRPDAATLIRTGGGDGDAHRSRGGAQSESRLASVAALEPRRVHARGARICWRLTSTSISSCRPTPSATASTTSPIRRPFRRR